MIIHARNALAVAEQIQRDMDKFYTPNYEGRQPRQNQIIDPRLVRQAGTHLQSIVNSINGTYENGWFDACAVMLRRLIETLIIEAYLGIGRHKDIMDNNNHFIDLNSLIKLVCDGHEPHLCRTSKRILPKIKVLGDKSAHNRTFLAKPSSFESLSSNFYVDLQALVQELLSAASKGKQSP